MNNVNFNSVPPLSIVWTHSENFLFHPAWVLWLHRGEVHLVPPPQAGLSWSTAQGEWGAGHSQFNCKSFWLKILLGRIFDFSSKDKLWSRWHILDICSIAVYSTRSTLVVLKWCKLCSSLIPIRKGFKNVSKVYTGCKMAWNVGYLDGYQVLHLQIALCMNSVYKILGRLILERGQLIHYTAHKTKHFSLPTIGNLALIWNCKIQHSVLISWVALSSLIVCLSVVVTSSSPSHI